MSLFSGNDNGCGCGSWTKANWKRYLPWALTVLLAVVNIVLIILASTGAFCQGKSVDGNGTSATTTTPATPIAPENSYVPKTADVEFEIQSIRPGTAIKSSEIRQLTNSSDIEYEMKKLLKKEVNLEKAFVRVHDGFVFGSGNVSTKVTLRIGWTNESMEFDQIQNSLANVTKFGGFDITPMKFSNVTDQCKFNKNENCTCNFDYVLLEFNCKCKDQKKTCETGPLPSTSEKATTSSARIETSSPVPQTTPMVDKSTEATSSAPKQGR
jgi:hypothetical protein